MTARGGAGKRFYDLTYMEYYYFSLVGVVLVTDMDGES